MNKSQGVIHRSGNFHDMLFSRFGFLLFILLLFSSAGFSQSVSDKQGSKQFSGNDPLWNIQNLSGNFGEIRGNHFHSGIDFKTREMEGLPVMAAEAGYVSRVKISSGGYGKAIYVTHPGGLVTVYGHLRRFYKVLDDSVRKLQDSRQQYEIEIFPSPGQFPVSKGELIGYSGNTGSSSGPHLHFETRHEGSELPFNPVFAGYELNDTIPPVINSMVIYEPGANDGLQGSSKHILEQNQKKKPVIKDTVLVNNTYFAGIEAYDLAGDDANHLGISSGKLFVNDSLVFTFHVDSFSFSQTRMVQAFIDYGFYVETGRKVILFYVMPGNTLPLYPKSNGMLSTAANKFSHLRIELGDASGNISEVSCYVGKLTTTPAVKNMFDKTFIYGKSGALKLKHSKIEWAKESFYESIFFTAAESGDQQDKIKCFSPVLNLAPSDVPVNEAISATIKCTLKGIKDPSKLVVARIGQPGNLVYVPGTLKKKTMSFKIRVMGNYVVTWDTIAPRSDTPVWENDDFTGKKKLFIPASDQFTGIKEYACFLDNIWVPAAYNSSRKGLVIYPEDFPNDSPKMIRITLKDEVNNSRTYEYPADH